MIHGTGIYVEFFFGKNRKSGRFGVGHGPSFGDPTYPENPQRKIHKQNRHSNGKIIELDGQFFIAGYASLCERISLFFGGFKWG